MQVQYKEMVHIMGKDQDLLLTSLVAAMTTTSTIAPEEILGYIVSLALTFVMLELTAKVLATCCLLQSAYYHFA